MSRFSYERLGMNFSSFAADATAKFELGTIVEANDGSKFLYVIAGATVNAGDFVARKLADSNTPHCVVVSTEVTDQAIGVCCQTLTVGQYGWILVKGKYTSANVATATSAGNLLVATTVDGRVGAYAGTEVVMPIGIALTNGSSNTADVFLFGNAA